LVVGQRFHQERLAAAFKDEVDALSVVIAAGHYVGSFKAGEVLPILEQCSKELDALLKEAESWHRV